MQESREKNGAANDRNTAFECGFEFRIVLCDGRGKNEQVRFESDEAFGVVASLDVRAASFELFDAFVGRKVRSRHRATQVEQQMAKCAHATAANADHVHARGRAELSQQFVRLFPGERGHIGTLMSWQVLQAGKPAIQQTESLRHEILVSRTRTPDPQYLVPQTSSLLYRRFSSLQDLP